MGIFSRRPKLDVTAGVVVDRAWVDPELDLADKATRAGDLDAGLALLKATEQCSDLRCLRVAALGRAAVGQCEQLEALVAASPEDPDLLVWLGQTKVFEAWAVRGSYTTEHVSAQVFQRFHAMLEEARLVLWDAIEAAPDDSAPWSVLQWVAIGQEVTAEDKQYVFNQGLVRQPDCYAVHSGRIQVLAPKWGGSLDALIQFGRETAARAKPGRTLIAITALVQAEIHLAASKPAKPYELDTYFTRYKPTVLAARETWLQPERQSEPYDIEAHGAFAYALRLYREPELAMEHVEAMQGRITTLPWAYEGDETAVFGEALARRMRLPGLLG
ncbi:hypothetical protein [Kribbella deserti]|uniref:DUF4034 domain-containing protein n=1 Tax=Kribbella deserti TaxID=1926257 RepID=A0ABV6QWK0_9ACTN